MYFYTDNDTQLGQLDGKSSYVVTFPKGQLPPVKGFWSLNATRSARRTSRYGTTLTARLPSILVNKSPGEDKESNWLPAPSGNFSIWLRAYWPDQAVLDGTWKPPVISRTVQ
jgi:hypothetical protein